MNITKSKILFFSSVGLLVFGVGSYIVVQKKKLGENDFNFINIQFVSIDKNNVTLNVQVELINNSDINAVCNEFLLDVYLGTEKIGVLKKEEPFDFPARGSAIVDLTASFQTGYFASNIVDLVLDAVNNKGVKARLDGYARIKSGFISATIPISNEKVINF